MPGLLTMSRLPVLLLLAALAGCADSGGGGVATSTEPPAAAPAPVTCPVDLSFVKSELVTPYPKLEEFIGKASDMAETWVREGLAAAMNRFNRKA